MPDFIELRGLRATGCHGVLPFEKTTKQAFEVDVILQTDLRPSGSSDDLNQTVSYADVAERAGNVVRNESYDLIERVAQRIADEVLSLKGADQVEVIVRKLHPVLGEDVGNAAVRVSRP